MEVKLMKRYLECVLDILHVVSPITLSMTSSLWMQEGGDACKKGGTSLILYVYLFTFFLDDLSVYVNSDHLEFSERELTTC
jgi:hypothetical protein